MRCAPRARTVEGMLSTTRTALAALAAAAIAAPSAGAIPMDGPMRAPDHSKDASSVVTRTVKVESSGFDWADAGLGAAGTLALLTLGAGAVVVVRRGQRGQA